MLSCRSDFFSWFLFWKHRKFHPKFLFLKESYHIYEEKSEIYLVWLKCWIKIVGTIKKIPLHVPGTCTCRFVSLLPVRQWTWVDKTVTCTSCQMYSTLVSFTNKTELHVIPDTLLKVSLNTNTTDRHIIRYNWNIVDSGVNTKKTVSILYPTHRWKCR